MAQYEDFLRKKLKSNNVVTDALTALKQYPTLKPSFKNFVYPDGKTKELVCLEGTIPTLYRGAKYNIPICIWLQDRHPFTSPLAYVVPTAEMEIKAGKHVDNSGKIYLPFLSDWKHPQSDLYGLIQVLCIMFGEQPPVFARKASSSRSAVLTHSQRSPNPGYPGYPPVAGTRHGYYPGQVQIPVPGAGIPQVSTVDGPSLLWTKAQVVDWFDKCVCKDLEIDREIVAQFMLMNGKGLNMLAKEDWLSRLPDLVGDLVFRKWTDLKKEQPNEQSSGIDNKKGKKSVVGELLTKAQVKDWFNNICKDLEIDKEMVSQFTLMNGKGLNLLLKEDWVSCRLPDIVAELLFRMWNDLKKEKPNEQSGGIDSKKEEKSVDGKLLTKAQVKDWFDNICKELEIDKEMISQFTLMNGKGLNLLLKEDWLRVLSDLVGNLLFRMWSDLKKEPK